MLKDFIIGFGFGSMTAGGILLIWKEQLEHNDTACLIIFGICCFLWILKIRYESYKIEKEKREKFGRDLRNYMLSDDE